MPQLIRRTVTTSWGPGAVFDYLLDFANAEEWDAGTISCRRTSGDGGRGTTYENVSEFRGNETTLTYTVERVEPPVEGRSRFVITGRNKTVTSQDTITVTPHGTSDGMGGSSVDYAAEMTFHGLAKLATPFLTKPLQKLGDDTAALLEKTLAEKAASAGSSGPA